MKELMTLKLLGQAVRERRERADLSLKDAAALLGVGPRFLLELEGGKASVQFEKSLTVAWKFGVRPELRLSACTELDANVASEARTSLEFVPAGGDVVEWVAARVIGSMAARSCGLSMWSMEYKKETRSILCRYADGATQIFPPDTAMEGRKGYRAIADSIVRLSSLPILDLREIVGWCVLSTLLGDDDTSVGSLWLTNSPSGPRLAPFPVVVCNPALSGAKGLKIGGEYPSDWLRADHYVKLAENLGVSPKVVFSMMEEMSRRAPAAVEEAVKRVYPSSYHRGHAAELVRGVKMRAVRMGDLVATAGFQGLSGLPKKILLEVPRRKDEAESEQYLGHETLYE